MARKLFDTSLFARKDFVQCDADVLFFRPFRFPPPADLGYHRAVFPQDIGEFYSIRHRHMLRAGLPPVLSRVNAGFFYWNHDFDLDFLEAVLGIPLIRAQWHINHIEQYSWALLAYRANAAMWKTTQVKIVTGSKDLQPSLVAGHFVTPVRPLLDQLMGDPRRRRVHPAGREVVTLEVLQARPLSWSRLAAWELRRQLWRWKRDLLRAAR